MAVVEVPWRGILHPRLVELKGLDSVGSSWPPFGRPPLTTQSLLTSARFTREYLPVRLSRRIRALRNLPYIIVSNPNISAIYNNYIDSLSAILDFPPESLTSLTEESKFTELLTGVVKTHSNTIPILAKGFLECRGYTTPKEATKFLDHHLRARIGTRLMAEQHIGLHLASVPQPPTVNVPGKSYIGTVDTELRPAEIIESCASFVGDICELRYGARPKLTIDGNPDITFPYIPVHLEYIITELLKNAFRATIEANLSMAPTEGEVVAGFLSGAEAGMSPGEGEPMLLLMDPIGVAERSQLLEVVP
ncbi:alpha-ketoacid dehydrogenase kinase [Tuber magnatum]|uniref:Protein-serine/threonine kinase n=1 Tax=Tuber magnatum TaxID=42249 RepID=A0A317SLB3_9PEZI|nr:alpha-ketoacid dehydrogenase kinase [Tuber magnatum]